MKLLLTFFLLGAATYANAQTIDKMVIASGSEAMVNTEIQLNSTLGEPLIGLVLNDFSVDQGFWAGSLIVEPLVPEEELGGIVVFPNPVEDQLNIFTNNQRVYGITLFSIDGRLIMKKKVDETQTQHLLDASILSEGVYVLQVFVEGNSKDKLFKVIKN